MKLVKRLLIFIAILLVLFLAGASVFVKFYGKGLIEETLKSALSREVSIEAMSYRFPLVLQARNIHIAHLIKGKRFFEAREIIARLSLDAVFRWQLIFDSVQLINPVIMIEKTASPREPSDSPVRRYGVVVTPEQKDPAGVEQGPVIEENQNNQTRVSIKRLLLSQGQFQYTNSSIDKDFSFALEDVSLRSENLVFPFEPGKTNISVRGRLVKEGNPLSGSSVEGRGWVDIVQRDMEAGVEIVEADGSVGMTAKAVSIKNDMEVTGEVKFQNILLGASKGDDSNASPVNDMILSALSSAGVKIGANFSFKTKMDDFRPEQVSFSGNVVTK
jgi:hypothetical protein